MTDLDIPTTPADGQSIVDITVDATPLTTDQARQLTSTIRDAAEVLWVLIARAHAGQAWTALGYPSWEQYVRDEFNMSRSRSYQLLDQARVIAAIQAAVPEGTQVHLTEAAARDLRTVLEDAVPEIRTRTEGLDPDDATEVLDRLLAEQRATVTGQAIAVPIDASLPDGLVDYDDNEDSDDFEEYGVVTTPVPLTAPVSASAPLLQPAIPAAAEDEPALDQVDVAKIRRNVNASHDLYSSLSALAGLPDDLAAVVAIIPTERHMIIAANLQTAQANLARFAELWASVSDDDASGNDTDG
jgi:hypothetical protein